MALSFISDRTPVDLLKAPFEQAVRPLRSRFDSVGMEDALASEQMKVYLRVRPFTANELEEKENQDCYDIESQHSIIARAPPFKGIHSMGKVSHKYSFNSIMGPECKQTDVFDTVVREPVKGVLEGRNALVFTYGITSSGKTYTVQGPPNAIGILPRALDMIFNTVQDNLYCLEKAALVPHNFDEVVNMKKKDFDAILKQKEELIGLPSPSELDLNIKAGTAFTSGESDGISVASHDSGESSSSTAAYFARLAQILAEAKFRERDPSTINTDLKADMHYSIWISYAEIYNEYVYDLLTPQIATGKSTSLRSNQFSSSNASTKSIRRPSLELRMDKRGSIYIRGLRCFPVTSADDAYRLLLIGRQNQQMASTRLNLTSSRSHTIFTIHTIRCSEKGQAQFARVSTLRFCDLAGSERTVKTQNAGDRLREAGNINTSLLTLGRCIQTLRNNQLNPDRPQLVPYRESKLTRLFQNFFTGKGKACMLVNINQCASMFDETLNVLKFSAVAKQVVVHQQIQPIAPIYHGGKCDEEEARRSRFKSLGLRTPKPGNKVSIAWENTPRSRIATPNNPFSSILFTGNDGTLVEEQLENTMTSVCEETAIEYDTEELLSIIEDLKTQLVESKKEAILVESKVREDVCREMDELVMTLETRYEEALREQETHMQEQSDRRIQLYLSSVSNSSKRARIVDPDDSAEREEMDQATESLVLRSKMEDLDAELSDLRSQCSDLREALAHVTRERDEQTLTVTSLKFKAGLNEREMEQRMAKDEIKIRELEMQLEKMMTQPRNESHISDVDFQIDQSRIMIVSREQASPCADQTALGSSSTSPPSQAVRPGKKPVFSPILPKRGSDEADKTTEWDKPCKTESMAKSKVFSPIITTCLNQEMKGDTSIQLNESLESCDTPVLKTVVKKSQSTLSSENDKLRMQLRDMQNQLIAAENARSIAEANLTELRQEMTNATAGIGSFLRHEAEADWEEELEQKGIEIKLLKERQKDTETALRELQVENAAKDDAFSEEQRRRLSLSAHFERLQEECDKRIEEMQRERRHHEDNTTSKVAQYKARVDELMSQVRSNEENIEIINKMTKEQQELDSRYKAEYKIAKERDDQIHTLLRTVNGLEKKSREDLQQIKIMREERSQFEAKYNAERKLASEQGDQIHKLRTIVDRLKKDISDLGAKNQMLESELKTNADVHLNLDKEMERSRALGIATEEMRSQVEILNNKYRTAKEHMMADRNQIENYKSEIRELTAKLKNSESSSQMRDRIAILESEILTLKKKVESKDQELYHTKGLLDRVRSESMSYLDQCNSLNFKCSEYEKEVNILKEKENHGPESATSISKERRQTSRTRGQTQIDHPVRKVATEGESTERGCSTRRVTRSMRHK